VSRRPLALVIDDSDDTRDLLKPLDFTQVCAEIAVVLGRA